MTSWILILAAVLAQEVIAPVSAPKPFVIAAGTHIPLSLINGVSTKHSAEGDAVYLETAFPILAGGRIVIPPGSYVNGTVTEIKRPGRMKGRGELFLRFDSLTMINGVTRDFKARLGNSDGADGKVDREEGKIIGEGNKAGDLKTVGEIAGVGTGLGAEIGRAVGHGAKGIGIGAGAGLALGVATVLLTRGPDAVLTKGTTIDMILDRTLTFGEDELMAAPTVITRHAVDRPAKLSPRP